MTKSRRDDPVLTHTLQGLGVALSTFSGSCKAMSFKPTLNLPPSVDVDRE
jgi:hypothetical protein